MTSHAAVVARGMGKSCVAGCGALNVDYKSNSVHRVGDTVVKEGDFISIDGTTGEVMLGETDHQTFRGDPGAGREEPRRIDDSPVFQRFMPA